MHHHLWQVNQHPHNTTGAIGLMSDISFANPSVFLVAGGSGVTFTFSLRDDIVSRCVKLGRSQGEQARRIEFTLVQFNCQHVQLKVRA
ncbi:hypothetical protein EV424DRAFT_267746 [Suillus variegatus]|nr:hypothetical protein EV424DRAFT_267746 [Suillus variegatus]